LFILMGGTSILFFFSTADFFIIPDLGGGTMAPAGPPIGPSLPIYSKVFSIEMLTHTHTHIYIATHQSSSSLLLIKPWRLMIRVVNSVIIICCLSRKMQVYMILLALCFPLHQKQAYSSNARRRKRKIFGADGIYSTPSLHRNSFFAWESPWFRWGTCWSCG
jgi:hypothetical protein